MLLKKTNYRHGVVWLTMALWLFSACGKGEESKTEEPKSTPQAPASTPASGESSGTARGTIKGEVLYKGKATAAKLTVNKDQEVCGKTKIDPTVVVSPGGKLQNAVVSVAAAPDSTASAPSKVVLDQKGCEYHPHVVVLPVSVTLEILNPDGILHNIHTYSKSNSPINLAQPKFKKTMTVNFDKPEIIQAKCDVHSWMNGWLFVTTSPYVSVSDANGSFQLSNLPAGEHVVEIWHEKFGKQTKTVKLGANETVTVNFEYGGS